MIALAFFAAAAISATPAAPAPPDGTYTYDLSIGGQTTTSTIIIKRAADGLHVSETTNILSRPVTAALVLDPSTLSPVSYQATYDVGTQHPQDVSITFGGGAAHVSTYGQQTTLAAQSGASHLLLLDGALPSGFLMLPAVAAATGDTSLTAINPGAITAVAIPLNRKLTPHRPASVPAGDIALSVVSPTAFSVWYDPKTFVMHELDVPLQNVVETLVKYTAATGRPSAVALARRGEQRRDKRPSTAATIVRR